MASKNTGYGMTEDNPASPTTDLAWLVVTDFSGQFNPKALELYFRFALDAEIDVDVNERQKDVGFTALHWAVALGNIDGAKILVKHGASAHIKDILGFTPLFYCTGRAPNVEMTRFLVEKCEASVHEKSNTCSTCLHGAAFKGALTHMVL